MDCSACSLCSPRIESLAGRRVVVAIAGTPNVGKSVIFNLLTGGRAWIGNWPGVTVEKKVGRLRLDDVELEVVDLPGIYGLTAFSVDELIARNFIVEERPDVVVCIVNAANMERGLYLAISLLELGVNMVIDVNMVDVAKNHRIEVNCKKLEELLRTPVVASIAVRGEGVDDLKKAIAQALSEKRRFIDIVDYGPEVEQAIKKLSSELEAQMPDLCQAYPSRWLALKMLEGDRDVIEKVKRLNGGSEIVKAAEELKSELAKSIGDVELHITKCKHLKVSELVQQVVKRIAQVKVTLSDLLDIVLTHRIMGIPIALSIIYLLFRFAFEVSAPIVDALDVFFGSYLHDLVASLSLPNWLSSLLADGIIAGVGAVMVFLPVIAFFFLGFAILEDVGYMARISFLVDRVFSRFKLPGKAIIPLIVGFGCNVPGVMAARPIEDENERKTAALIAPLASCSARLPVYLVIGGALFGAYAGSAVLFMYVLGLVLALLMGLMFRALLFKGPSIGFIVELPPYLKPEAKSIIIKTWERTKRFLIKAGTVILLAMIIVWVLSVTGPSGYLGPQALEDPMLLEESWVGVIGHGLSHVFAPMGWDWRSCSALFFGFIAKEVVVGAMAMLYGVSEEALSSPQGPLAMAFTPITALAYMAFVLIYVPCLATLAVIRSELGWRYALMAMAYEVCLAYVVALAITGLGAFIVR